MRIEIERKKERKKERQKEREIKREKERNRKKEIERKREREDGRVRIDCKSKGHQQTYPHFRNYFSMQFECAKNRRLFIIIGR